jgi:hypothetical protein
METYPHSGFVLPTTQSMPKSLQQVARVPSLFDWNAGASRRARLLSYESTPIEKICQLPEARAAQRLVIVLRDAPNFIASLKRGIPELANQGFLSADFRGIVEVYRGYLREALGRTNYLGSLREKTLFVSYNRWHMDEAYRHEIVSALGGRQIPGRGLVASYIHASSFQASGTPADRIESLSRWRFYRHHEGFWNLTCDPELMEAEQLFHGPYYFMGLDFPAKNQHGLIPPPDWAIGGTVSG